MTQAIKIKPPPPFIIFSAVKDFRKGAQQISADADINIRE